MYCVKVEKVSERQKYETIAWLVIALLPVGSLAVLGKEALPHVNDPPVHVVARVHLLDRVHDMRFVEFLHPALQKKDTSVTFWAERNFFLSYI